MGSMFLAAIPALLLQGWLAGSQSPLLLKLYE